MFEIFRKTFWILRHRPRDFFSASRQYLTFLRARAFRFLAHRSSQGIWLAENVRVQALGSLLAERPAARLEIGRDSVVYEKARIEAYGRGRISIGEGSIIGDARIVARESIRLGARVVTSWNVFIQDFDPHPVDPRARAAQLRRMTRAFRPRFDGGPAAASPEELDLRGWDFPSSAIEIGDDVWLGANVTVLKGARIGAGCVVASGAVVPAGEFPAGSVLAGVPAKVIKKIDP